MTAPPTAAALAPGAQRSSLIIAIASAAAALVLITVAAAFGERSTAAGGLATILHLLVFAGGPAAAYLAGAVGLGAIAAPLWRSARDPLALQAGAGLAIMLTISHALGAAGLLAGAIGQPLALGVVGVGALLLARQLLGAAQDARRAVPVPLTWLVALPAAAVMLVAACNPPGWLWPGEGNGYDALSYHLQLPQEWLGAGRIAPLEHNIYSYLPSYVEAAFLHIGVMMGAPPAPGPAGGAWGLLAADGAGVIAAQLLSAMMALLAAWLIARLTLRLLADSPRWLAQAGAGLAAAATLATPWTVVVGALPYTEPATLALGAAAGLAALETGLAPWRRAVLTGALVGVACGAKMTSILLVTPLAAALLLGSAPWRSWLGLILPGAAAGLVAIAPWMVRNFSAGANPVFPHAIAIFGQAHWTDEQVARYHAAHSFDGNLLDRARMLALPDRSIPPPGPDASAAQRQAHTLQARRGLTHPHWAATPALVIIFGALAFAAPALRRHAALLWIGLLGQILAWLLFTHLQSRFLTPLLIPGAPLIGLGVAAGAQALGAQRDSAPALRRWLVPAGCALALLAQSVIILLRYSAQRDGDPNAWLALGPDAFSGAAPEITSMADQRPEWLIGRALPPGDTIYLLGDGAPFYFLRPTIYTTTWDKSILARAIDAAPDDPGAWRAAIRSAGCRWILLNERELARLSASGFLDPALTPDTIARLLAEDARLEATWPDRGQSLFRLLTPPGEQSPP
ncbi:MAG: hypothetical protein ACF8R7_14470 [Phycisphaerales bacterium JB039]